jgi:hypothetical protein
MIGEMICLSSQIEGELKELANKFRVSCLRVFRFLNLTRYASFSSCISNLENYLPNHLVADLYQFKQIRNGVVHHNNFSHLGLAIELGSEILEELKNVAKEEKSKGRFEIPLIFLLLKRLFFRTKIDS